MVIYNKLYGVIRSYTGLYGVIRDIMNRVRVRVKLKRAGTINSKPLWVYVWE